jgi:nucleoside-diphosphate-sugar epimerase
MRLYGGGTQVSDMIWVGDVAAVFVTALEALRDGQTIKHPIDVGQVTPTRVIDVAETIQRFIPGAIMEEVPMRPGEPQGGVIAMQSSVDRLAQIVMDAEPRLDPSTVIRAIKYMGTVVSADPLTLAQIGMNPINFLSLDRGVEKTVEWYRHTEGVTWSRD